MAPGLREILIAPHGRGSASGGSQRGRSADGREHRPPWWLYAAAAVFAGYFAVVCLANLSGPWIGASWSLVSEPVVQFVSGDSPASRSGLRVGDRLVGVAGGRI